MINDPNMISKLWEDFDAIPEDIIKDAIQEVIQENREQEKRKQILDELKNVSYVTEQKYYCPNVINEYVHKQNWTSYNIRKQLLNKKNKEIEAA